MFHANNKSVELYVLRVWLTTIVAGSLLTFTICFLFTSYASELGNILEVAGFSLVYSLFALLITTPVALLFYITCKEVVVRFSVLVAKALLIVLALLTLYVFFIFIFEQGNTFIWEYGSTTIYFYSFLFVFVSSIGLYKWD